MVTGPIKIKNQATGNVTEVLKFFLNMSHGHQN